MIEPARPSAIVIQIGIGSGPGTASRASAPTTRPHRSRKMMKPSVTPARLSGSLGERVQLAPQILDLVPELGGVLEPQLLGRREHLLLERDHEPLELLGAHAFDLLAVATAPARHRRSLEREELRDVGDTLLDRLRRDPVLLVVGELLGAAAVGLVERAF